MDSTTISNLFYAKTRYSKAQWSQITKFGGRLIVSIYHWKNNVKLDRGLKGDTSTTLGKAWAESMVSNSQIQTTDTEMHTPFEVNQH